MIDVSSKTCNFRAARAGARLRLSPATVARIRAREVPKGDPLEVARVAAIQAAKDTSRLLPFCHPIPLDHVGVVFEVGEDRIAIKTSVSAIYKTGVEMEALMAASVAALTLYDMLKMLDQSMVIEEVFLLEKCGGKSDFVTTFAEPPRAAVIVLSDSAAAGQKADLSGRLLREGLEAAGFAVKPVIILPDEPDDLVAALTSLADGERLDLVVTTGGTGLGPRDRTPEVMEAVFEREIPGLAEALREHGRERTPYAALSRGRAGMRGRTLIVNLPGAPEAARHGLEAGLRVVLHALSMINGGAHPKTDAARSLPS